VLFLLAAGLTAAAYLSLIIPEFRQETFYVALVGSCIAEAVFFGYLAYAMSSSDSADASFTPTRLRGGVLVAIWLLVVLVIRRHKEEIYRQENPPYLLYGVAGGMGGVFLLFIAGLFLSRRRRVELSDVPPALPIDSDLTGDTALRRTDG
jgi:hypothetical protein